MKLSHWAKEKGILYRTAWMMFNRGQIIGAYKLPTGTIIVPNELTNNKKEHVITYARVSSSENKDNLESQSNRLIDYCNAKGWKTHENIKEIGSGLNDSRPKLIKLLKDGAATKLVVEHKDRLSRFGATYIEYACKHFNCDVIYINNIKEEKEDLIQDFVNVITSFCARIYGQRRSKRKTEQLIKELQNDTVNKNNA
jgi:predicted site-specific integrase-resolvase